MIKFKLNVAVFFVVLLAACAKQPVENHRYFLPEADLIQHAGKPATRFLQIRNIQLADFLNDGGLVLQLDDITLNQAKNHLWADNLHQQINRALQDRLNQQQQVFTVVGPQTDADLQLSLVIDAFHGRHDGLALTSGQWQLHTAEGERVLLQNFHLQTELREPGYPALVRALGVNLDALAASLATVLAEQS
ncbi:MAG: ABC-type transport auxiliary lipoprotein family protein [Methylophaga sp.]|nr:ABC-type transport auxiliary lipoprotein family protein [Methylophaga sp.]